MGSSPFDNIYPWSEMKIVNISDDGTIINKDEEGFSFNNPSVMVYIPEFWYRAYKDEKNNKWTWEISSVELNGFKKHPGSGRYISRYHIANTVSSTSTWPDFKITYDAIINKQFNCPNIELLDINTWSAVQLLYLIEFANFNSREMLGMGISGRGAQQGNTDMSIYHTLKANNTSNMYRYIEDPFSNVLDYVHGICVIDNIINIGMIGNSSNKIYVSNIPGDSGIISNFAYDENYDWLFIPCEIIKFSELNETYVTNGCLLNSNGIIAVGGCEYSYSGIGGIFGIASYPYQTLRHVKLVGTRSMYCNQN